MKVPCWYVAVNDTTDKNSGSMFMYFVEDWSCKDYPRDLVSAARP